MRVSPIQKVQPNLSQTKLIVAGLLHQYVVGFDTDRTLLYVSIAFALIHLVVFGRKLGRKDAID